jgi:hypothetical protein
MNWKERQKLRQKVAQKITDDAPLEALVQSFYNDQYAYLKELDDDELIAKADKVFK